MNYVMPSTIAALQEMVTESFIMTARIDRMQSVLDADLNHLLDVFEVEEQ